MKLTGFEYGPSIIPTFSNNIWYLKSDVIASARKQILIGHVPYKHIFLVYVAKFTIFVCFELPLTTLFANESLLIVVPNPNIYFYRLSKIVSAILCILFDSLSYGATCIALPFLILYIKNKRLFWATSLVINNETLTEPIFRPRCCVHSSFSEWI